MGRTGVLIALAVAATVGLVFGFSPELVLRTAALFFDPASGLGAGRGWPGWHLGKPASWLIARLAAPAFGALAVKLGRPRRPMLRRGRAAVLMIVTLALG